jgi:hypothetical protein
MPAGMRTGKPTWREPVPVSLKATRELWPSGLWDELPECSGSVHLLETLLQMRVDLFCSLDAAKFFWTTIALVPSNSSLSVLVDVISSIRDQAGGGDEVTFEIDSRAVCAGPPVQ